MIIMTTSSNAVSKAICALKGDIRTGVIEGRREGMNLLAVIISSCARSKADLGNWGTFMLPIISEKGACSFWAYKKWNEQVVGKGLPAPLRPGPGHTE